MPEGYSSGAMDLKFGSGVFAALLFDPVTSDIPAAATSDILRVARRT